MSSAKIVFDVLIYDKLNVILGDEMEEKQDEI